MPTATERVTALALTATVFALACTSVRAADSLWAHSNVHAWCVVPFDALKRGPEERAQMLDKLGIKAFAYDWRAENVPTFDTEIETLQKHGIKLLAWWFPFDAEDPLAKSTLEVFKRQGVHPQLWVAQSGAKMPKSPEEWAKYLPAGFPVPKTGEDWQKLSDADKAEFQRVAAGLDPNNQIPKTPKEQRQRVEQEAVRIQALVKLAAPYGTPVELYSHNGWYGREENQLAIVERLAQLGVKDVGMVYNFSHARDDHHDDSKGFSALWAKIHAHVVAVNITGMHWEGKEVYPSQGDSELDMMRTIESSGWHGPIGLIAEKGGDAEMTLHNYLVGLDWLASELKQPGSGGPRPFPPVK